MCELLTGDKTSASWLINAAYAADGKRFNATFACQERDGTNMQLSLVRQERWSKEGSTE